MDNKHFYITTPIYYPSGKLHIGHAYCTVATYIFLKIFWMAATWYSSVVRMKRS